MAQPTHQKYTQRLLKRTIRQALDHDLLSTAAFTAERLVAIDPSNSSSRYLMGLVLYRQGRYKAAYNVTLKDEFLPCVYVFAMACLMLELYEDGIRSLEKCRSVWIKPDYISRTIESNLDLVALPDASALWTILGKLYQGEGNISQASKSYIAALKINPYLWEVVESLCKMGLKLNADNIYPRTSYESLISTPNSSQSQSSFPASLSSSYRVPNDPFSGPPAAAGTTASSSFMPAPSFTFKTSQNFYASGLTSSNTNAVDETFDTPTSIGSTQDAFAGTPTDGFRTRASQTSSSLATTRMKRISRSAANAASSSSSSFNDTRTSAFNLQDQQRRNTKSAGLSTAVSKRQNGKMLSTSNVNNSANSNPTSTIGLTSNQTNIKPPSYPSFQLSNHKGLMAAPPPPLLQRTSHVKSEDRESAEKELAANYVVDLYRNLTSAYSSFSIYDCDEALRTFEKIPLSQRDTPWVQSKMGRIYFEQVNYAQSEKCFKRVRELDRCRLEDMEYYSTLLWHLRKSVELSFLSRELADLDRSSLQAWITMGNSFSLQRETDLALQCFKRAVHLDPASPYAYTLQAHEYVTNEAYENAQDCFRLAIRADPRHYNAWYGLGMVFMRLGDNDMALFHFQRAAAINPVNAVLICCIGMVKEKTGRVAEALQYYDRACQLQPNSALSRYKKARTLVNLKSFSAALVELNQLLSLAPDEASVHFLLGQLHKELNNRELAVKHYTIALNLDPKGSHVIKEALEGLAEVHSTPHK